MVCLCRFPRWVQIGVDSKGISKGGPSKRLSNDYCDKWEEFWLYLKDWYLNYQISDKESSVFTSSIQYYSSLCTWVKWIVSFILDWKVFINWTISLPRQIYFEKRKTFSKGMYWVYASNKKQIFTAFSWIFKDFHTVK